MLKVNLQERILQEDPGDVRMGLKEMGVNARNLVDSAQDRDYSKALGNA